MQRACGDEGISAEAFASDAHQLKFDTSDAADSYFSNLLSQLDKQSPR
jgi:hypothetical protein